MSLSFDNTKYELKTCEVGDEIITYRAFTDIPYCEKPAAPVQKLNLYVPEAFYEESEVNGFNLDTVPIFMPNTVGGYREGPVEIPGVDPRYDLPNATFRGIQHGYVVVSAGIRGISTEVPDPENPEGKQTIFAGRAPALIVDMKAVIRFLRANSAVIPGNTDYIFTSGTSAGGALSALTGASGNSEDYLPYLEMIGAVMDQPDDIFAANCYCPIHNLDHADMAYEWLFHQEKTAHGFRPEFTEEGFRLIPQITELNDDDMKLSAELKSMFPAYVNSLELSDENGKALTLDADGEGSFKDYVKK